MSARGVIGVGVSILMLACAGGPGPGPRTRTAQACLPDDVRVEACAAWRVPPMYPEEGLQRGAEAIVLLEFSVIEDGSTDAIQVLRYLGHPDFVKAAIRSVEQWKYQPAMRDGVPVVTRGLRVALPFRLGGLGDGMTPRMVTHANEALAAIGSGDDATLREKVRMLERWRWTSLYEAHHVALLRGILAFKEGHLEDAIVDLEDATSSEWRYMPPENYAYGLGWKVRAHALAEQHGEALATISQLDALRAEMPKMPIPPDIERIRKDIEALRETRAAIEREITIRPAPPAVDIARATYVPLRRTVRIDRAGEGFPTGLRLWCGEGDHTEEPAAVPGVTLRIEHEDCRIELRGDPGTRARMVELPLS